MARQTNWEIFCCLCGTELQYKRVMEQSPNGGNLRYIEEEIGFVCKPCLDGLPDAKPPVPHTPPKREPAGPMQRAPAPGADAGPLRGNW
jgi:hypothetical protein